MRLGHWLPVLTLAVGVLAGRCWRDRLAGEAVERADRMLAERDSFAELFRVADSAWAADMARIRREQDTIAARDTVYRESRADAARVRALLTVVRTAQDSLTVLLHLDSANQHALDKADSVIASQQRALGRLMARVEEDSVELGRRAQRVDSLTVALQDLRAHAYQPPSLATRALTAVAVVALWEFVVEPQLGGNDAENIEARAVTATDVLPLRAP